MHFSTARCHLRSAKFADRSVRSGLKFDLVVEKPSQIDY